MPAGRRPSLPFSLPFSLCPTCANSATPLRQKHFETNETTARGSCKAVLRRAATSEGGVLRIVRTPISHELLQTNALRDHARPVFCKTSVFIRRLSLEGGRTPLHRPSDSHTTVLRKRLLRTLETACHPNAAIRQKTLRQKPSGTGHRSPETWKNGLDSSAGRPSHPWSIPSLGPSPDSPGCSISF